MAIKTFDANRVGGGTFQLEQDSLTGEYKVKEVGFVKLPELKLPEIEQAAPVIPDPSPDPSSDLDTGTGVDSGDGGGGGGIQQDFTGASTYKNIKKEATGDSDNLMQDATTLSSNLNRVDRTSLDQGAIKVEDMRSLEAMPKAYQNIVNEYNRHQADVQQRNMTGNVDEEQALSDLMYSRELRNQINEMKGTSFVTKEGAVTTAGRADPEIIKAAPKIADFSGGPKTVPAGTLTGAKTATTPIAPGTFTKESIDKSFLGEEGDISDKSAIDKAKDIINNSVAVKVITKGAEVVGTVLKGVATTILGPETNSQVHAKGYFNVAGTATQPQRIAGNPAENVFAGANRNARDLDKVAQKRIDTIEKNLAAGKYRDPAEKRERLERFKKQQDEYRRDRNDTNIKNYSKKKDATPISQLNPNEMRNVAESGDPGGDPGCFIKGTLITMFDGSKKPVEQVDLGDNVAVGGKVFAVGKFLNTELYDYKGIKVSGSHMVNEDGVWLRVRDTKHGKSLGDDLNTVYVFGSENRRILINDILFTDYFEVNEQDQLINNEEDFFNNWKSYGNIIDKHNVNTLNAN